MSRHIEERGLTLVETLVALAILGGVAAGVLAMLAQSARLLADREERLLAEIVAHNAMAEAMAARATPPSDIADAPVRAGDRSFVLTRASNEFSDEVFLVVVEVRAAEGARVLGRATALKAAP